MSALVRVSVLVSVFAFARPCVQTAAPASRQISRAPDALIEEARRLEASGNLDEALSAYDGLVERFPGDWRGHMLRAQVRFRVHENDGALRDFDRVVELVPGQEPYLWQRGISQYYAGKDDACIAQLELHRTVNPDDVENAVWHFLCVARRDGVDAARAALLPVGPDERVPMEIVYRMFQGEASPAEVEEAAERDGGPGALFYAQLYVGLYKDALGDIEGALPAIQEAAQSKVGGYMRDVAGVHLKRMLAAR